MCKDFIVNNSFRSVSTYDWTRDHTTKDNVEYRARQAIDMLAVCLYNEY